MIDFLWERMHPNREWGNAVKVLKLKKYNYQLKIKNEGEIKPFQTSSSKRIHHQQIWISRNVKESLLRKEIILDRNQFYTKKYRPLGILISG